MRGTQTSLDVMFVIGLVAGVLGMVVGALAGYFRGWLDQLLMRITDLVITFPVLVIGAVLGKAVSHSSPLLLALCLGAISWTTLARLVRGEFLTCASASSSTRPRSPGRATSGSCASTCCPTPWA